MTTITVIYVHEVDGLPTFHDRFEIHANILQVGNLRLFVGQFLEFLSLYDSRKIKKYKSLVIFTWPIHSLS